MYKKIWSEIKIAVFDWDGTLRPIDMLKIYEAHLKIYKFLGINPNEHYASFETYNKWGGIPDEFYGKNLESRENSQRIFHEYYDNFVSPFPWAKCVVKELSKKYSLAILSNSAKWAIKRQLGNLADYFEIIVGSDCVNNMKPHPEGLIHISNELQVEPKQILQIGDTAADVMAAKNAKAMIGIVNWGEGNLKELSKHNLDYVFISPLNLM